MATGFLLSKHESHPTRLQGKSRHQVAYVAFCGCMIRSSASTRPMPAIQKWHRARRLAGNGGSTCATSRWTPTPRKLRSWPKSWHAASNRSCRPRPSPRRRSLAPCAAHGSRSSWQRRIDAAFAPLSRPSMSVTVSDRPNCQSSTRIERVLAEAKEHHGLRRARGIGLEMMNIQALMSATVQTAGWPTPLGERGRARRIASSSRPSKLPLTRSPPPSSACWAKGSTVHSHRTFRGPGLRHAHGLRHRGVTLRRRSTRTKMRDHLAPRTLPRRSGQRPRPTSPCCVPTWRT